jgi:rhamnogalacturonyl hydrolase YesR
MNKVGENTKINVVKKILRTTAKVAGPALPNSKKRGGDGVSWPVESNDFFEKNLDSLYMNLLFLIYLGNETQLTESIAYSLIKIMQIYRNKVVHIICNIIHDEIFHKNKYYP